MCLKNGYIENKNSCTKEANGILKNYQGYRWQ